VQENLKPNKQKNRLQIKPGIAYLDRSDYILVKAKSQVLWDSLQGIYCGKRGFKHVLLDLVYEK